MNSIASWIAYIVILVVGSGAIRNWLDIKGVGSKGLRWFAGPVNI